MRKILGLLGLSLMLLLIMSSQVSATPVYGEDPEESAPALQVQKYASATEIELGEEITVKVNITNWSETSAFDLNITEPAFSEFSVTKVSGYEQYKYVELGPQGSVFYEYTIKPTTEGEFVIEPTTINYDDENGTRFVASSSYIPIDVYVIPPPPDRSEEWRTLFLYSVGIFAIPVALFAVNKFYWSR